MNPPVRCVVLRHSPRAPTAKPYVERLPKFGPLERYEMVLEWHPSTNRNPRIQRLGFKASGSFTAAVEEAQRLAHMLNRSYGKTLTEISKADFCRLIAVYEEKAFRDYSAEPLYNRELQRQAVKRMVDTAKDMPEPRPGAKLPAKVRVQ